MTFQQLKNVCMVADTGKITEAAKKLYISQPSLTNAIHELEKEMNIVIFQRTNKGIVLLREGEDFLGYARQVLEQAAILEDNTRDRMEGEHNSFYFSEEIFSPSERKKNIRVRDRAPLFNLLLGLNGYTVWSGVIDKKLNGKDIIAVPLADESEMRIGYIMNREGMTSRIGTAYLNVFKIYMEPGIG